MAEPSNFHVLPEAAPGEEELPPAQSLGVPNLGDQMDAALEDRVLHGTGEPMLKTELPHLTLSMFPSGSSIRVRIGNPHAPSELYECVYESADEANTAMLDGGILQKDQIADMAQPAGVGIELPTLTAQQLESAGLKRHGGGNL